MTTQEVDPRRARKRARRSRRRHDFLEAAQSALRRHGITEMTLADVAREADETETLLYYYFENRDDLLVSLAVSNIIRDCEVMRQAVEEASSGIEAVPALMRALVAVYRDDLESFRLRMWLSMRKLPADQRAEVYPHINAMIDVFERRLSDDQRRRRAHADVDPRVLAGVAMNQAEGILTNYALVEGVGAEIEIELDTMVELACCQAVRGVSTG